VKNPSKKEARGESVKIESDGNKEEEDNASSVSTVQVPRWVQQNLLQQVYDNPDLMAALKQFLVKLRAWIWLIVSQI
jgi:hypothetical protein